VEEAVKIAKSKPRKKPKPKAQPPAEVPVVFEEKPKAYKAAPPPAELEEITCPRCGAKAKIDWAAKRVTWE